MAAASGSRGPWQQQQQQQQRQQVNHWRYSQILSTALPQVLTVSGLN
jgi:hypothetical protein